MKDRRKDREGGRKRRKEKKEGRKIKREAVGGFYKGDERVTEEERSGRVRRIEDY